MRTSLKEVRAMFRKAGYRSNINFIIKRTLSPYSSTVLGDKVIYISWTHQKDQEKVLAHEVAHQVLDRLWKKWSKAQKQKFYRVFGRYHAEVPSTFMLKTQVNHMIGWPRMADGFVSYYAQGSAHEDWAETVVAYLFGEVHTSKQVLAKIQYVSQCLKG